MWPAISDKWGFLVNRLSGKAVLITGAAKGIGRATAFLFSQEGAKVFLVDLDKENLQKTLGLIKRQGGRTAGRVADVSKEKDVRASVRSALKIFGTIDVLVNNAGILGPTVAISEFSERDWDRVVQVNVKGTFLFTKHLLPFMIERSGGCIINIASVAGIKASRISPAYSASKGAIVALTKTLALAYGPNNIRVNCICPGSIETDMLKNFFESITCRKQRQRLQKDFLRRHPLGRFGRGEDIAHAALYLASAESSFITGVDLVVDGGSSL